MKPFKMPAPLAGLLVVACVSEPDPRPPEPPGASSYWVERSDAELSSTIASSCASAVKEQKPVLLAFSAPWCADCRLVRALESQPPLSTELERWEKVVVHVGRFDRHKTLLEAFDVGAIAHWVALRPVSCEVPVEQWPVLKAGTFEPATGFFGPKTAEGLAAWLVEARGG